MPERIHPEPENDLAARAIGLDVAGMLRYQMAVLDRENRLESGSGAWLEDFGDNDVERAQAVHASVLRTVRMAMESSYFEILDALYDEGHLKTQEAADRLGIGRLTLHERVSDLVSAGLANKVPEADQVAITPSGSAIFTLIRGAAAVAARDLSEGE